MRNGAVHVTPLPCDGSPCSHSQGSKQLFCPQINGLETLHVPGSLLFFMGAKKTLQKASKTQLNGKSAKDSPSLLQLIHFPQLCQHTSPVLCGLRPWNNHGLTVIRVESLLSRVVSLVWDGESLTI